MRRFQSILRMGFELEIGASEPRETLHQIISETGGKVVYDGSIATDRADAYPVEIVSPPLHSLMAVNNYLKYLEKWLVEANETMGFHIHVSLKNYSVFSNEEFVGHARKRIEEYAVKDKYVFDRFNNKYCSFNEEVDISRQMESEAREYSRYRFINFCYSRHRTIEFRIFPSSVDRRRLFKYCKLVADIVEEFFESELYKVQLENECEEDDDEPEVVEAEIVER